MIVILFIFTLAPMWLLFSLQLFMPGIFNFWAFSDGLMPGIFKRNYEAGVVWGSYYSERLVLCVMLFRVSNGRNFEWSCVQHALAGLLDPSNSNLVCPSFYAWMPFLTSSTLRVGWWFTCHPHKTHTRDKMCCDFLRHQARAPLAWH